MGVPQDEPGDKHRLASTPRIPVSKPAKGNDDEPPEIPPRMKKKGPELPEKPPHLRLATLTKINPSTSLPPSSQTEFGKNHAPNVPYNGNLNKSRQPSTDQKLFLENARRKTVATDREILVAATKGSRERPPEKRQREPAKLLTSTFKVPEDDENDDGPSIPNDALPILLGLASPKPHRRPNGNSGSSNSSKPVSFKTNSSSKVSTRANARYPVLLVPRSQLDTRNLQQFWSSYPMSYGVWVQNSGSGDPQITSRMVRKAHGPSAVELRPATTILFNGNSKSQKKSQSGHHHNRHQLETKIFVSGKNSKNSHGGGGGDSVKPRSSSVTRSGSLTSHDSTSSDSGNEMFPKSVLKKHRRETSTAVSSSSSNNHSKKNVEHKKNVTFNAFATVQLMEE